MKKLLCVLLCMVMVLGLCACGATETKETQSGVVDGNAVNESAPPVAADAKFKEEIVIGLANVFTTTDLQSTSSITNQVFYTISHSNLLRWNYETNQHEYDLAKDYTVSEDGCVYTFYLQENAYFHNDEPVKASDIIFTFERGLSGSATKSMVQIIKEMKAIDDHTVEITLTGPSTGFLYDITNPNMAILSEVALTEMGDEGTKIGSGAFYYDYIDFGNEVKMVRFDKYYGEMPKSQKLTFRQYKEDSTRVIALQTGDIDYCQTPSTMELEYIAADPDLDLIQMKGTRLNYMVMNVSEEHGAPFTDIRVRQAMNMLVNKDDVVAVAANGFGSVQNYYYTDITDGFNGDIEGYSYNVEKAKELLAEAGYPDGFEFSLICHDSTSRAIAPVLQDQFAVAGITMKIDEQETAVRNSLIKENKHDACMAAHVSLVSIDNNLRLLFYTGSGNNRMKYSNPEFDKKLDDALVDQNVETRMQTYAELQEFVVNEALCIPLYVETLNIAKKSSLQGIQLVATGCHNFTYAYIVEE